MSGAPTREGTVRGGREKRFRGARHVHLGERVRLVEVLGEEGEGLAGDVEGEAALLLEARGRPDAHGDALGGLGLDDVELADAEGDEVGGHDRGRLEADVLPAVEAGGRGLLGRRHVGQGDAVDRGTQRDVEAGLERGLVPAGERAAGVRRLRADARQGSTPAGR